MSCAIFGRAIINFPDPALKAALLSATPENNIATDLMGSSFVIDENGDGEIDMAEAATVSALSLGSFGISDLDGLQYFVNLVFLEAFNNDLTTFGPANLPPGTGLNFLNLTDNELTSFEYNSGTAHTN